MKDFIDQNNLSLDLIEDLFDQAGTIILKLLGFIAFILLAWVVMRIILYVLRKALSISRVDNLAEKLKDNEIFSKITISPSQVILGFVKGFIILLIIILGADILGLEVISLEVVKFLGFVPTIFVALVIFSLGIYLSSIVKKFVAQFIKSFGWPGSHAISSIVSSIILLITTITALNHVGIDTHIITDNLSIILGLFMACAAIALGLGSKDVVQRILFAFYTRKNFQLGQRISFDGIEGTIISMDNISITLNTAEGRIVVPIKDLVDHRIRILE